MGGGRVRFGEALPEREDASWFGPNRDVLRVPLSFYSFTQQVNMLLAAPE